MTVTALKFLYLLATVGLSLYGYLGLITLWLFYRHRNAHELGPAALPPEPPPVTVQLPIFNERFVVNRLIRSAIALDYPRDRLQIQVLDDSTDDTTLQAAELVRQYRSEGIDITLLHRSHRQGFKAGALANGLNWAAGEYLAVFDADFKPEEDFLRKTIPYFVNEPGLGMVQVRWGHLNDRDSPLTAAQAIALDKHFAMEQTARHWADLYPKFNGAGGVWRKSCVEDAGGWQSDTLCEDLCLSTRAILNGWKFRFLNDVVAPAELPTSLTAYKNQQDRWAKGSIQCLKKYGSLILRDKRQSVAGRLYVLLSMSAYFTHILLLLLLLTVVPLLAMGARLPANVLLIAANLGQPLLFILAQYFLHRDWRRRLRYLPVMLLMAMGLAPNCGRALCSAVLNREHVFVRTPKGKTKELSGARNSYRLPLDWIILVELFFLLISVFGLCSALQRADIGPIVLLSSCVLAFGVVSFLSIRESLYN